ncbi:ABC transporter substrate-binding protein [Fusibacter ferrireducens]|uniref:ABC transporter substrate-binding protein n=1 Tax=Fusibacter ferrireducens TaxID=2785058 RepID=A0ABR9ZU21_9FIRM|nr:ABC transporter substrate-binding protein [Fusibacter ferrireducens]MBF4693947.1 ABC transporter substrate-binding protein [Fusibacter ferrireducens]
MKSKHLLKRVSTVLLAVVSIALLVVGCSSSEAKGNSSENQTGEVDTKIAEEKIFTYGDTTFNAENDEANVNPHNGYAGWACIRYGIGETLFKYSDTMALEPWLATEYKNVDENTWMITLKDDVTFSSGRKLDAAAVKACIEDLVAVHKRASGDLKIQEIIADGQVLTIKTTSPVPALMNYLSDPYGCIIDMEAGITEDGNVSGTGPYIATKVETDKGVTLIKNKNYWNGTPKLDTIYVKTISNGDTLTMAMQSGELDGAYGLPYASLPLLSNEPYSISSVATSRSFFGQINYKTEALQDANVRAAIAGAIDKESFTKVLLNGNGTAAVGPFPASFAFGDSTVKAQPYDLEASKDLLSKSGWTDTDGDGYVDKNGEKLTIRWLTYPSRQELPLLAESVQASMKKIGIDVVVNCTANSKDVLTSGDWDIYASAFVCAPTGDPEYFFTTHCLDTSTKNRGGYHNDELEALEKQMSLSFDDAERERLATQMTQILLDDNGFIFASHLKMSIVSGKGVTGLVAHPCDYYVITADLDKN